MLNTKVRILMVFILMTSILSIRLNAQKIKSLKNIPLLNLRLEYDKSILRINNTKIPIGISIITESQNRLTTTGYSNGTLRWSNFKVRADSGKFSNGILIIPNYKNPPQKIELSIIPKYQPDKAFKEYIWLNHIISFHLKPEIKKSMAPGTSFNISLKIDYNNGVSQTFPLNNSLKRRLNLNSEIYGGKLTNGEVEISDNVDEIINHSVFFKIWDASNPLLSDSIEVVLNYMKNYSVCERGNSGFNGFNGTNGTSGTPGIRYYRGGNQGENGENGRYGERGPDLEVYAHSFFDSILLKKLIYVEIYNTETEHLSKYLINPEGGSLHIVSRGGNGGDGGSGGKGGDGAIGNSGTEYVKEWTDSTGFHRIVKVGPGENGGHGGPGGYGGYGGDGGDGGNITFRYTHDMIPYLKLIVLESFGGMGGFIGSGGLGGAGGFGGSGNPSGLNGRDGQNGGAGENGENGLLGTINYIEIQE
jgi:hypothetical protein